MAYQRNFGRLDRRRFLALGAAAGAVAVLPARADQAEPAIVYDYGGKWDKSFNEAAFEGAERFRQETGQAFRDFEIASESQRDQALQTMARRGAPLVIGVGFANAVPLDKLAKTYPQQHFAIIDGVVNQPNVQSVIYREQEGCYLVGMLAALATKSGTLGFVGGMDVPITRRYLGAFIQGAQAVKPGQSGVPRPCKLCHIVKIVKSSVVCRDACSSRSLNPARSPVKRRSESTCGNCTPARAR